MKKEIVDKILHDTQRGYDNIAEKFGQTRKYFWRDLYFTKDYVQDNSRVFDFGCGNGRLLEHLGDKDINYIGVDISGRLLDQAQKTYKGEKQEFIQLKPSFDSLPFPESYFNTAFSIAVFHHIPSRALRKKVAEELFRVIQPDGYVIITVWNLWQERYRKDIYKNWKKKLLRKSQLDWNDRLISFTDNDGKVFQRYHHAFRKNELRQLFEKVGFVTEKCFFSEKGNIIYVGQKHSVIKSLDH